MEMWEEKLNSLGGGDSSLLPFLELSVYDMRNAARNIDCPYCRRHMMLEAEEISRSSGLCARRETVRTRTALGERWARFSPHFRYCQCHARRAQESWGNLTA